MKIQSTLSNFSLDVSKFSVYFQTEKKSYCNFYKYNNSDNSFFPWTLSYQTFIVHQVYFLKYENNQNQKVNLFLFDTFSLDLLFFSVIQEKIKSIELVI